MKLKNIKTKYFKYYSLLIIAAAILIAFSWEITSTPNINEWEKALKDKDIEQIRSFIKSGANCNAQFRSNKTPLIYAVSQNNVPLAKLLISNEADINLNSIPCKDETLCACQQPQKDFPVFNAQDMIMLNFLLSQGAKLNVNNPANCDEMLYRIISNYKIPIHEKLKMVKFLLSRKSDTYHLKHIFSMMLDISFPGDVDIMDILIEHGVDINSTDPYGTTFINKVLGYSRITSFEETYNHVAYLLKKGINPNKKHKDSCSTLFLVVGKNYSTGEKLKLMKLLIKNKAEIQDNLLMGVPLCDSNAIPFNNNSHSIAIINFLVKNGVDINATGRWEKNLLIEVIKCKGVIKIKNQKEFIEYLLSKGIQYKNIGIIDILVCADISQANKIDLIKFFLDKGVNPNEISRSRTALMHTNDISTAKLLIKSGADVNLKDESGNTALYHYIKLSETWNKISFHQKMELVELLIKNGADVNSKNNEGKTVLNIINNSNRFRDELKELLIKHGARK